jgi:hypothetical protein
VREAGTTHGLLFRFGDGAPVAGCQGCGYPAGWAFDAALDVRGKALAKVIAAGL